MPDSGTSLGADLYGLTIVAKRNFPTVAADYRDAHRLVATTADLDGAFRRPEHFGGGPVGEAMAEWIELRDRFAWALGETATNLELTSDALLLAVRGYAASDHAAADELHRLLSINGQPHVEGR